MSKRYEVGEIKRIAFQVRERLRMKDVLHLDMVGVLEALGQSPIVAHLIVIPVREIEAWLLADHEAIARLFQFKVPLARVANPEAIQHPKEHLSELVYRFRERRRGT